MDQTYLYFHYLAEVKKNKTHKLTVASGNGVKQCTILQRSCFKTSRGLTEYFG